MRRTIVILTAAAILVCYAPTILGMVDQWSNDEDMGHGFLVPLVAAWIIWRERDRWRPLSTKPSAWGFLVLAAAACMQVVGELGAGLFAASMAFLLTVIGAVICLGGFALLRAWAFPLLLALFMLPKLAIVYNQTTLPLQLLGSKIAAGMLTVAGLGVIREGNILDVGGHRVFVAEACNGIRYLLPLAFSAMVFAYVADPKPWMRVVLLVAAVPVAILANALRVAAVAYSPALDAGTAHALAGAFLFMLAFASLILTHRMFNAAYARYRV